MRRLLSISLLLMACGSSGKTASTECRITCRGSSQTKVSHFESCQLDDESDTAATQRAEEKCVKDADDGTCDTPSCTCTLFQQTAPKVCSE